MDTQCDFCRKHRAVLYCRADSARLCLFCDRQVHSANLLSRKHIRSFICDNCCREPVAVRCATDKLALCQDCDWDAHGNCSISSNHHRSPLEGFSGCPGARELASIWGFAIIPDADEEDLMLNYPKGSDRSGELRHSADWTSSKHPDSWGTPFGDLMVPNSNPNVVYPVDEVVTEGCEYGRNTHTLSRQLLQVYIKDCSEELASEGFNIDKHNPEVEFPIVNRAEKQQVIRSTKESEPNKHTGNGTDNTSPKIWDFNLGQQRNHNDSGQVEKTNEVGSYLNETSTSNPHSFWLCNEDDMINFMKSSNVGSEAKESNVEVEAIAKNRGDAMKRYQEKKKNRRYEKCVRYESRKVRADSRQRVKGRFVKASEAPGLREG